MTILENSKLLIHGYYYEGLKKQYGDKCELLYTDTDSFVLEIETEDIYEDMAAERDLYDTSNYPNENPLYSEVNKKVLGKMKDECGGTPIEEVVCLRSKIYSVLKAGEKNIRKAKGVKKCVIKKHIKHEDYKECYSAGRSVCMK